MGESFEELQRHLVVAGRSLMLLDKRVLDQDARIINLEDALDNSQSLLVMVLHTGADPIAWGTEDISRLLTKQIVENRTALTVTRADGASHD